MVELVRLEFRARWAERHPQRFPGRAINAWLYGELARINQAAADALHDAPGVRQFTAAITEEDSQPKLVLSAGPQAATLLSDVADRLTHTGRILLDGHWLQVEGLALARTETFANLVTTHLLHSHTPRPVRLEFLTPTTFHSRGRTLPLPVPELVFSSLLERWHAFGGIFLGEQVDAVIANCTALRWHRLRSESIQMEGRFSTFLGKAEFTLVRPPPEYCGLLAALAAAAEFTGVGQKTAMGFGCVRTSFPSPRPRTAGQNPAEVDTSA